MVLNTGVVQGHVLSPFLFILFVNVLSRYLTLFAQRETDIQTLLESVSVFEEWSGLPVKIKIYCVMRVGDQHSEECNDPQIRYRGWLLRVVDDEEDVNLSYLLSQKRLVGTERQGTTRVQGSNP